MDSLARARVAIDAIHMRDPARDGAGNPAELTYADRMEDWVRRLVPDAAPLLLLAARCQHLERWAVPRSTFPMDRVGYLRWRKSLYTRQAELARDSLIQSGVAEADAGEVATWVSKSGLKTNPGTQALEDAACLVFLENEIAQFAAQHQDYPPEKFVGIIRKTWAKMSEPAQAAAQTLTLDPGVAPLVRQALQSP